MQANIRANATSPKTNIAGSQIARFIGLSPSRSRSCLASGVPEQGKETQLANQPEFV
jgi:hypothetical protein